MTKLKLVSLLLALSALGVPAQGQSLGLKVGRADSAGTLRMLLVQGDHSLAVEAQLTPMSAAEKAQAVVDAVVAQDPSTSWRALADGSTLTFQHRVSEEWLEVDAVKDVADDTGSGNQLAANGGDSTVFSLSLSPDTAASGVTPAGQPSFFTVTLTDTLAWTHPLQQGETAAQMLDQLVAFLAEEAGAGVEVTRVDPGSVTLRLAYDQSSFNWQVTDSVLLPKATGENDAGVVDR